MTKQEIYDLWMKTDIRPDRFWGKLIDWILTMEQCNIGFDVISEQCLIDMADMPYDPSPEIDELFYNELFYNGFWNELDKTHV